MSEYDDLKARIEQLEKSLAYTDGIVVGLGNAMIKPGERLLLCQMAVDTGRIKTTSAEEEEKRKQFIDTVDELLCKVKPGRSLVVKSEIKRRVGNIDECESLSAEIREGNDA